MPTSAEILAGLTQIAHRGIGVAIAWHLALVVVVIALLRGWHPSIRTARLGLSALLTSVAAFAFVSGNPFNGVVFAVGASLVGASGVNDGKVRVVRASPAVMAIGRASIAFGSVYPHFLDVPAAGYVIAAPLGLVPCPSLALAIGFAILGNGLGARAWTFALAGLGLFYAAFGVIRLGVYLDLPLALGSLALVAVAIAARRPHHATAPAHAHGH